ncbi:hypothetical protein EV702DRAFT_1211096 [Suillus placidus]|uniref:Uncharacterized protein n=1 Tax=Suillus placidus TaxID=48579 RepID=A0A9P7D553_9AGAM|nr:hypothetical protein EV702DRAFT_1211096 [Suillus placidus]
MHPTYLYVPKCKKVLQLVQLAWFQHPFSGFSGKSFVVIGYLAVHKNIYLIYVDETYRKAKLWLAAIKNIGTLGITDGMGITYTHPLFESADADGEFIREFKTYVVVQPTTISRWVPTAVYPVPTNNLISMYDIPHAALSTAKVETPLLAPLASTSVNMPFTPLEPLKIWHTSNPLDLGNHIFWPLPSVISATGMTAPEAFEESHLILVGNLAPNTFEELNEALVGNPGPAHLDMDLYPELAWRDSNNLWGDLAVNDKKRYKIVVQRMLWERVLKLTKSLFLGSLWVRLHGNPFRIVTCTKLVWCMAD